MTDARHPDRWLMDRRIQRLSAAAYRAYSMSLMYAVANRTDGFLSAEDLAAIPHFEIGHAGELVKAELFAADDSGWYIVDYMATQSSRAQLEAAEAARVRERERSAANRAKTRGNAVEPGLSSNTADGTSYGTPYDRKPEPEPNKAMKHEPWNTAYDTGKARQGKARPGQEELKQPNIANETDDEAARWPTDDAAVQWRTKLEDLGIDSVEALMKHAEMTRQAMTGDRAVEIVTAAFPGRAW